MYSQTREAVSFLWFHLKGFLFIALINELKTYNLRTDVYMERGAT